METSITCVLCNSLALDDGNFLTNTDEAKKNHALIHFTHSKILDDQITEDEVLQRCFLIGKPKIEPLSKSECRQSLLNLCKSLLKDQPKSPTVVCNMCEVMISTNAKCMVKHALAHLETKLYKCQHCGQSMSHYDSILRHIRRAHSIRPTDIDFEDKTVDRLDEISNRIKSCFAANYPRTSGGQQNCDSRVKSHRSIVQFCRSIYIQQSKPASLECNFCGLRIKLRGGDVRRRWFSAMAMYQHAAAHLEVKLFTCHHCSQPISSKWGMIRHLRKSHQIVDGNSDNFDDRSEKFHSEYLKMIERCFSGDQARLEESPIVNKTVIKVEAAVRSLTPGSKLTVERHLFCNRLIRKIAAPDGKVKCLICSKRLIVTRSGHTIGEAAFFHLEKHLQKPLYRCKVCKRAFNTHPVLATHLRTQHALGLAKNYECVADKFHDKIMAMVSKCYDADG